MTRLRFPRSARLTRHSEFAHMRKEGRTEHGRFIVCGVAKGDDDSGVRVGIITSRKVGSAVVRNRVRRRLREIFRADRPCLTPGFWVVLIARASAAEADFDSLRSEWRRLAKRAGLLLIEG